MRTVRNHIQPRERLNTGLVEDYQGIYTEAAPASAPFPPLEVFEIDGAYYVADGFHRLAAARAAGIPQVRCRVSQGTPRDAMLYAAEANARHGLRYTAGDKARIVQRLLGDAEIAALSDRAMARRFGLSHTYVSQVRKRLDAERTVAADLATVATRARSPRNKERERLAGLLCPLLPADELPTAEELAGMLWRLKQEAADALERVAQYTRRLDTRPKGEVVPDLQRLIAEARRQERDPEEMPRAYPGTFEERQALRSDPHRHRN